MTFTELVFKLNAAKLNMKLPRKVIKSRQQKKLREMLLFAYKHSPYYHKVFKEAGINSRKFLLFRLRIFPLLIKIPCLTILIA